VKSVFVDTSAFVALFYDRDQNHEAAKTMMKELGKASVMLLMTDYIFDETVTGILSDAWHEAAVKAGEFILGSKIVNIVWLDESLKLKAWDYFKRHDDKTFSFTDCTSFVVMKELNVREYFAFDEDYRRAGFAPFPA